MFDLVKQTEPIAHMDVVLYHITKSHFTQSPNAAIMSA